MDGTKITCLGGLVDPFEDRLVEFFRSIEEGSVSTTIPHVKFEVLEVAAHKLLQFVTKNVFVHSSLKDKEGELVLHGEQSTLVLSTRQSEKADLRVLS